MHEWTTVRIRRALHQRLIKFKLASDKSISTIVSEAVDDFLRKYGFMLLILPLIATILPMVANLTVISPQEGETFTEGNVYIHVVSDLDPDLFERIRIRIIGDNFNMTLNYYDQNVILTPNLPPGEYSIRFIEYFVGGWVSDVETRNITVTEKTEIGETTGTAEDWDALVILLWFVIAVAIAFIPATFPEKAYIYVLMVIMGFVIGIHEKAGIVVGFPFAMMLYEAVQWLIERKGERR